MPVLELVTSTYPRTFYLIQRCKSLYLYDLMYGLVAGITAVISSSLLATGTIKLQGPMIESRYVQAILIGISVKAVLHINIFTLTSGKTATPIGFETFTRFFEGGLLRDLKFYEFMKIDGYLAGYVPNLTVEMAVFRDTLGQIPRHLLDDYLRIAYRDRWSRRLGWGLAVLGIAGAVAASALAIRTGGVEFGAIAMGSCFVAAIGLRVAFTERYAYEKIARHFAQAASRD